MLSFFKPGLRMIIFVWMVLLSLTTLSLAQSRTGDWKSNIPFRFVAGNQTLPAGQYTITPLGESTFRIQGSDTTAVTVQTHSTERREAASVAKIVFQHRAEAYVLSELWIAGNRIGRQVFMPADKKEPTASAEIAVILPAK